MKISFTLLAIASVSAQCDCLTEEQGLPPAAFFTEQGYAGDYGNSCKAHDSAADYCQEGGANFGEDWCQASWCYVSSTNTCEPAAQDSLWFADTDYALQWSTAACAADAEDSSVALYASALIATVTAVAASI